MLLVYRLKNEVILNTIMVKTSENIIFYKKSVISQFSLKLKTIIRIRLFSIYYYLKNIISI